MHVSAMTLSFLLNFYIFDLIYYKMVSSRKGIGMIRNELCGKFITMV